MSGPPQLSATRQRVHDLTVAVDEIRHPNRIVAQIDRQRASLRRKS
jgi:hypothetical protein